MSGATAKRPGMKQSQDEVPGNLVAGRTLAWGPRPYEGWADTPLTPRKRGEYPLGDQVLEKESRTAA